jgi:hypothetical protein
MHCGLARHFKTDPTESVALCFGYAKALFWRRRHCGLARHFKTDLTKTVALCFGYAKTLFWRADFRAWTGHETIEGKKIPAHMTCANVNIAITICSSLLNIVQLIHINIAIGVDELGIKQWCSRVVLKLSHPFWVSVSLCIFNLWRRRKRTSFYNDLEASTRLLHFEALKTKAAISGCTHSDYRTVTPY